MLSATLQFVIAMIACAINERMQRKLDYAQEEVRVLRDVLEAITGSGRISFTAEQRRRLARYVVKEFMAHYLAERFHQGIGGQIIRGEARATNDNGTGTAIVHRSRLGGFQNYYHREAA